MARKQSRNRSAKEADKNDVEGNVDKIRDILFGGQMRDFEQRIDAIEKRLAQSIERTARDIERRIERLDGYARREFEKLTEQMRAERKDRTAETKKGASELVALADQVEAWFVEMEEQQSNEMTDLRNSMHQQVKDLTMQIRDLHEEVQTTMQKEASMLAESKVGKEDMATLLTDMALRLTKQSKPRKS